MSLIQTIKEIAVQSVKIAFDHEVTSQDISVNDTKAEFEGEYTIVTFGLTKILRKKPEEIAEALGAEMKNNSLIADYNIIKGFLNLSISDASYLDYLKKSLHQDWNSIIPKQGKKIMVEFSSPNTNKPLHFGHLRNNFLGDAVSRIYEAAGYNVCKANLINDRGIHICKSMLAWQKFGEGATPESTGTKGDHLVGEYYVKFNNEYKKEIAILTEQGKTEKEAEREAPLFLEAQEMLRKWEAGDKEVVGLWETMNQWVYDGFDKTYESLGITFDRVYHESKTYLLGKAQVDAGLAKGVFFKKEDGSVWINLEADGLDEKLVLRADGTSVYITQDIGTAELKFEDEAMQRSVYVIGDEQNYHMKVLKLILEKLEKPYAPGVHHLSYGMVELPHGKMKSREGTAVDADDMIAEMLQIAQDNTEALGKVDGFTEAALSELYNTIGLGALKFYLLRVDPKKKMIFNPEESIDFQGFTGPFVQYTHARLSSILRKAGDIGTTMSETINADEKSLIYQLEKFATVIEQAAEEYNPSLICNYIFNLAKNMNSFLANNQILNADSDAEKNTRLYIAQHTKNTIAKGLNVLGISAPERM